MAMVATAERERLNRRRHRPAECARKHLTWTQTGITADPTSSTVDVDGAAGSGVAVPGLTVSLGKIV